MKRGFGPGVGPGRFGSRSPAPCWPGPRRCAPNGSPSLQLNSKDFNYYNTFLVC